jgi:hypothetical protein
MELKKKIIKECDWAITQIDNGAISVPETRSFFTCLKRILENYGTPVVAFTRSDGSKAYSCPTCGALYHGGNYCNQCGQALSWGLAEGDEKD